MVWKKFEGFEMVSTPTPHATLVKFGYPSSLIREYRHWAVLLRPQQVTLGSLVLISTSDATAFGSLPPEAYAELAEVTRDIEAALEACFRYDRINYLMLMMIDPHVHFHVLPRYETAREFEEQSFEDTAWPKPADLGSHLTIDETTKGKLQDRLRHFVENETQDALIKINPIMG